MGTREVKPVLFSNQLRAQTVVDYFSKCRDGDNVIEDVIAENLSAIEIAKAYGLVSDDGVPLYTSVPTFRDVLVDTCFPGSYR